MSGDGWEPVQLEGEESALRRIKNQRDEAERLLADLVDWVDRKPNAKSYAPARARAWAQRRVPRMDTLTGIPWLDP